MTQQNTVNSTPLILLKSYWRSAWKVRQEIMWQQINHDTSFFKKNTQKTSIQTLKRPSDIVNITCNIHWTEEDWIFVNHFQSPHWDVLMLFSAVKQISDQNKLLKVLAHPSHALKATLLSDPAEETGTRENPRRPFPLMVGAMETFSDFSVTMSPVEGS